MCMVKVLSSECSFVKKLTVAWPFCSQCNFICLKLTSYRCNLTSPLFLHFAIYPVIFYLFTFCIFKYSAEAVYYLYTFICLFISIGLVLIQLAISHTCSRMASSKAKVLYLYSFVVHIQLVLYFKFQVMFYMFGINAFIANSCLMHDVSSD